MLKKTSVKEDRRLEILGILLLAISVFIFVSLLGYDPSEEPSINPSIVIHVSVIPLYCDTLSDSN